MKSSGYYPALDGMRAIAILLVMAYHFKIPGFESGYLGVDIFFVLSGYLITSLLIAEWTKSGGFDPKNFYMRRILRLYPALILFILCLIWIVPIDQTLSGLFYYSNLKIAFGDLSMFKGPLCILWSLSIEEQFYLFWPWLLTFALKGKAQLGWLIGIIIALTLIVGIHRAQLYASGATYQRWYFGTDTRFDGLLLGSGLAILLHSDWFKRQDLHRFTQAALWSGTIILIAILGINSERVVVLGGLSLFHLGAALVLLPLVSSNAPLAPRILTWKPLVYIGQISYGLYLWHQVLNNAITGLGLPQLSPVGLIIRLVVSLSVASASYFLVEKRILRYKNLFQPQLHPETNSP